ncbi:protein kinase domain, Nitrogen network kinase 1, Phloem protein 2-like protein [Artemisia annua]|uniref:Protein kinase domain, Nitrogen network kinase 1, Phloem protein 2-like protein n=1 Tax=Artemisia annua TaxID=35608 RepID=A0A2U1MLW9_ARTAN|nr:protein kinase domain, Nitrogen network kinase 1, Phloem protein 2-like protein [Artemisia annua]
MASSMKGFEDLEIQLEEIKSATNNFDEENVIGHGGFGKVYKGELSHSNSKGRGMVALKRLNRKHGQGDAEFHKEVRMLSCYRHENIISLLGFSSERDEMILVYEYAPRGSLDRHLKDVTLTWTQILSGKLCFEFSNGQLKILVPMWKQSYEQKQLSGIVFQGLTQQMNPDSLETFADIAYKCLRRFREERPAMSLVIEKLQESLALQELHDLKPPKESLDELKVLLTQGFLINEGKTLFCLNEKGEHIERIFIEACLDRYNASSVKHRDDCVDSRFPGGRCYEYNSEFKARVRGQYLTPQISYTANLVFRYSLQSDVNSYKPLRYKVDGEETKLFMIYPLDMRQDGWFIAPLYQFTSEHTTVDLQFEFEYRWAILLVAGIEFQPSEEKVELQVFEEYQDIVEVASQSVFYTSLDEPKQILSKGVYLNRCKTWFSLNKKGEHCKMISIEDCLIPNQDFPSRYESDYWSRFPAGSYRTNNKGFKIHVKTHLLSPSITYTINLAFYASSFGKQGYVDLKYRLRGETTTSTVYLANRRDDDWFHMVELYQFTCDGIIVDLEIDFDDHGTNILVESIFFQPLEKVEDKLSKDDKVLQMEDKLSKDDKVENIQTISDSESDTYWEQKLLNDYEKILNLSKDSLQWTSKKQLYSILRRGFLINNGQQWFTVDKHGKKCLMISARATWVIDDKNSACESSNESRFGEVIVITSGDEFEIKGEIKSEVVLPETNYASYLVYKLPQDQSTFEAPMYVWEQDGSMYAGWYIYLLSPPHTPVLGPKLDENSYNPLNRYKGNAIPQQRSDGWIEVQELDDTLWIIPRSRTQQKHQQIPQEWFGIYTISDMIDAQLQIPLQDSSQPYDATTLDSLRGTPRNPRLYHGPTMDEPESKKLERYIGGFSPEIRLLVISLEPDTMSKAIDMAIEAKEYIAHTKTLGNNSDTKRNGTTTTTRKSGHGNQDGIARGIA